MTAEPLGINNYKSELSIPMKRWTYIKKNDVNVITSWSRISQVITVPFWFRFRFRFILTLWGNVREANLGQICQYHNHSTLQKDALALDKVIQNYTWLANNVINNNNQCKTFNHWSWSIAGGGRLCNRQCACLFTVYLHLDH